MVPLKVFTCQFRAMLRRWDMKKADYAKYEIKIIKLQSKTPYIIIYDLKDFSLIFRKK